MKSQQVVTLSLTLSALLFAGCDSGVEVGGSAPEQSSSQTTNQTSIQTTDQTGTQFLPSATSIACVDSLLGVIVCPASDMAKITRTGPIPYEHPDLDWSNGPIQLHAARNETIAFQLLLRATQNVEDVEVELGQLQASAGAPVQVSDGFSQSLFNAFYHPVDNAGYKWGPPTTVLPWPDEYPDALIPVQSDCQASCQTAGIIDVQTRIDANQAVWVDTYIDTNTAPGVYTQNIIVHVGENRISLPVQITVHNARIPDKPSINAVGELYRTYALEGAGSSFSQADWQQMSHCYQQMAHKHRMIFIERLPDLLTPEQLVTYADIIEPAMTGELFTEQFGYTGPGTNTPVALWKTPWPQTIDGVTYSGITDSEINRYEFLARDWDELVTARGWTDIDYFAYVFDEVDGPSNNGDGTLPRDEYIALVHDQFARVQSAIDRGTESNPIDLIWTSHSNPTIWQGDPILDLTGTVRLWSPNASAADTNFLQQRMDAGEKTWFYHSGHPAVGAHSINVSGIEMRTWGVVGARYNIQGQLMWAVNLGSDELPFREPQFNPLEDRAGNGVFVYPGNQLDKIGHEKSPGPIPSIRLKSWRRGLQDAELFYLAQAQSPVDANTLITQQIPVALTDGNGDAAWSSDPADWINFHRALLELASQP